MSDKRVQLKRDMEEIYQTESPNVLHGDYSQRRGEELASDGRGLQLSLPYKDMKRSISFIIRHAVGDKAVRKLNDSWTMCVITKILEITLADKKHESEPDFTVRYEVMDIETGAKHNLYNSNLMTVDEAIHRLMVFHGVGSGTLTNIVREANIPISKK